jgi:hypothetical protein
MAMHFGFMSAKGLKNAFRCCPKPSDYFLNFSGIYSHFGANSIY